MFTVNREELAWAAGFFDGEGYVGVSHASKRRPFVQVAITQVDRRVLDRFAAAVGVGRTYGPVKYDKIGNQPQHRYNVGHHPAAQAICALLWTWLSPVKREQFTSALAESLAAMVPLCRHRLRPSRCVTCVRGHWAAKTRRFRERQLAHALLVAV